MPDDQIPVLSELSEEAGSTSLPEAIAKHAVWRETIDAFLDSATPDQGNACWRLFWREIDNFAAGSHPTPSFGIFLLLSCSGIYTGRWVYSRVTPVGRRLLHVARVAVDALTEENLPSGNAAKEEIGNAVSRSILANLRQHRPHLTKILESVRWTFEGSRICVDGIAGLDLVEILPPRTLEVFEDLRAFALQADDPRSRHRFIDALTPAIAGAWPRIEPKVRERWFREVTSSSGEDGSAILDFYTPARSDLTWFSAARDGLETALRNPSKHGLSNDAKTQLDRWCESLKRFDRPLDGGRALLEALRGRDIDSKSFASIAQVLDHAWQTWRQDDDAFLLSILFHEKQLILQQRAEGYFAYEPPERWARAAERLRGRPWGERFPWLVDRLIELPTGHYRSAEGLSRPDERAAWRWEVIERFAAKPSERRAASEFLLWWSSGPGADDAELVVMSLTKTAKDRRQLHALRRHISRTVQVRARAVDALLDGRAESVAGATAPADSLAAVLGAVRGIAQPADGARTWIGDHGVEALLHTSAARAERAFCTEYPSQWANEEERLVTRLLAALETEFKNARTLLRDVQVRGLAAPVDVHLEYRETTKREEGEPGIGARTFAVDVAFVVRVESHGTITTERVSFVQCKKLEGTPDGGWKPSFLVPREQMDDLIVQTESSFYLFLVPPFLREECWVVPARLVRNLVGLSGSQHALPRFAAGNGARSFAHWLTYDAIGLWVGDERRELIEKAKGNHPGRRPRFVVSITIRRGHDQG